MGELSWLRLALPPLGAAIRAGLFWVCAKKAETLESLVPKFFFVHTKEASLLHSKPLLRLTHILLGSSPPDLPLQMPLPNPL